MIGGEAGSQLPSQLADLLFFGTLAFLAWPLAIIVRELIGFRDPGPASERQRKHHNRQRLRHLMQAGCLTVAIGSLAVASTLGTAAFTTRGLIVSIVVPTVALVAVKLLGTAVVRADRTLLVAMLGDVHRDQQELRRDLDELHRTIGSQPGRQRLADSGQGSEGESRSERVRPR